MTIKHKSTFILGFIFLFLSLLSFLFTEDFIFINSQSVNYTKRNLCKQIWYLGGRVRVWPPASSLWWSLSSWIPLPSATPRCESKLAGNGGAAASETRSRRGSEAQERVREPSSDSRAGSNSRSERRLWFRGFLESGEKGQGVLCTRTHSAI